MHRSMTLAASWMLGLALTQAHAVECVRSEPQPLVAATTTGISAHRFQRVNAQEAVEDFTLRSGERFRLEHGGCEYYVIQFTVWPAGNTHARLSTAEALSLAARGLGQLDKLLPRSVFDLGKAASTLEHLRRSATQIVADREYPVAGDGEDFLQTRIVFNADPSGAARLRLIKGPL